MNVGLRVCGRSAVLAILVVVMAPPSARAQLQEGQTVSFTGRVHAQWNTTSAPDAVDSEFLIRRARITADVGVNDLVSGRVQPEFVEDDVQLRDAYVKLSFSPYFEMTMGQFKRPFDLFTLESSTRSLTIERAGKIRGAGDCPGVGGICSYSRFTEKLNYSDRDIGVRFAGALGDGPLTYAVSLTNGEGAGAGDVASEKSFTARLEYQVLDDLVLSANGGMHDFVNEIDPEENYGSAFGIDVDWGSYSPGFHFQWSFVQGDNWTNLTDLGESTTFRTAQGVASYRFAIRDRPNVSGIEPVLRISWADPDTSVDIDSEYFTTAGVILHFLGRNRLAANLEMWDPSIGDREWSLKVQTYLHF